jgi:hypothetical protein
MFVIAIVLVKEDFYLIKLQIVDSYLQHHLLTLVFIHTS